MEPSLSTSLAQRPQWTIDIRLERSLGQEVRVAAESFFPIRWNGELLPAAIPVGDLILPDNTRPGQLPVFFEGRLCRFERRIGVVFVTLDAPTMPERSAEGMVFLRGDGGGPGPRSGGGAVGRPLPGGTASRSRKPITGRTSASPRHSSGCLSQEGHRNDGRPFALRTRTVLWRISSPEE